MKNINNKHDLEKILMSTEIGSIFEDNFLNNKGVPIDLSIENNDLIKIKDESDDFLNIYLKEVMKKENAIWCFGGYGERRNIYQKSTNFQGDEEVRDVHLGLDIWTEKGTKIFAPLDGQIHSFNDNNNYLDYGPTIILEHKVKNIIFYTLYGHLSRNSLLNIKIGDTVKKGENFASVGGSNENGSWPTHIHFQIIMDMMNKVGDFPGVSSCEKKEIYLNICPNPLILLKDIKLSYLNSLSFNERLI